MMKHHCSRRDAPAADQGLKNSQNIFYIPDPLCFGEALRRVIIVNMIIIMGKPVVDKIKIKSLRFVGLHSGAVMKRTAQTIN